MENRYVIIVAGGRGLRMGGDVPKQFLPVGGKPVLMRTLQRFHDAFADEGGIHIILVLPRDQQTYWRQLCDEHLFVVPHQVATGGETRFHSVGNGLALVPDDGEGVVGVHDGVRPFVSAEVIRRCYDAAREQGAVVPVVPVVETVRQLLPEGDSLTVDRERYRLVQTPQTFRIPLFKEAMRQPYQPGFTDDASVVENLGYRICLVEGNRENIKLTTPEDMLYAEYLCGAKIKD
ncbi:MAG: 2-C-methyl-D-erythritol 4-phosphate cytidylyltransferase [Bacteroidaceae bacterium]|nr:2-C-methyl-D-erythritol 4-phosphate cytidylyltransferase [Bacteroidaceae bacterium]